MTLLLPFLFESTGVETFFRDECGPEPRSRRVFTFHRPEELTVLLIDSNTLQAKLKFMPKQFPLITTGLWGAQVEAINNLEKIVGGESSAGVDSGGDGVGEDVYGGEFRLSICVSAANLRKPQVVIIIFEIIVINFFIMICKEYLHWNY